MIYFATFAALFTVMVWGAPEIELRGLALVTLLAAGFAALLVRLSRREHTPMFVTVTIFALAYGIGAITPLTDGFSVPLPASPTSVALAMFNLLGFLTIATAVGGWCAARMHGLETISRVAGISGTPWIGIVASSLLLAATAFQSFRTGMWSYYTYRAEHDAGGLRLSLLYLPLLLGYCAALGRTTLKTAIGDQRITLRSLMIGVAWVATLVLVFLSQSRRLMISALALSAASAWSESRRVSVARAGITAGALVAVAGALLAASFLWRQAGIGENAVEQLQAASEQTLDTEVASRRFLDRLTYLWLDSVTVEHLPALQGRYDLFEVARTTVITAIPGALMPDKYRSPMITCDQVYETMGLAVDLPCTPTADGLIFGGALGLFTTAIFFGITLGISTALYRSGTFAGLVLSCVVLSQCLVIEAAAFPIAQALRNLMIAFVLIGAAAWLLRTVTGHLPQTASSVSE